MDQRNQNQNQRKQILYGVVIFSLKRPFPCIAQNKVGEWWSDKIKVIVQKRKSSVTINSISQSNKRIAEPKEFPVDFKYTILFFLKHPEIRNSLN